MIIGIVRSGSASKIQGVDFHPAFQQIALLDTDTGELQEQRLLHREDAEKFYRALTGASQVVRIGDVSTTVSV